MTDTSEHVLTEEEERHQILNFTKYVLSQRTGNFPELNHTEDGTVFPSIRGETTNRGYKLYQDAKGVSWRRLRVDTLEKKVFYSGSDHKLLARKRMKFSTTPQFHRNDGDNDTSDTEESDDPEDLHDLVDVRKVLSPISSLADVATHPAVSRTFQSKVLRDLALDMILMVEKEQESVISYSRLLEVFLGDFPDALHEEQLGLPGYDHKLKLPEEDGASPPIAYQKEAPDTAEDLHQPKEENTGYKAEEGEEQEDPFFAIPKLHGIQELSPPANDTGATDQLETTRQLAQIALQRNQEFIRNLQKIRNCIVKTNRIRERILVWGKEMAGIPEDDVTVPSALHIVKRGLISATTNHMDEEAEEDDIEEE
ncbi:ADL313Wp [Eremothecium gossypii ATCC 10895]|uniref:ADL313Wp n=1 Tax=Eremothecium gossypii (strain ATCC 10895 / CBS 109.51 / FGSC 9923 / NRRL Y-1056) TaxID=284811 RepID=Q75BH3_EREGS|nr:ADL313Wp [Eremothecium gossypii ATCC 10895]AAS51607.1 ADL313Wp [Eremothecium gossypii ATCC 10895]